MKSWQDELDREAFLHGLTLMPWDVLPDLVFDSTRAHVFGVPTDLLVTTTMPGHETDITDVIRESFPRRVPTAGSEPPMARRTE